eukprot:5280440-Amphidinium_carterae.1
MAPLRNLVRAWEMRNHEKLETYSWREVANWIEQHPADMSILTQGAMMTPTVLLEGKWDTWSYADLMVPDTLLRMLKRDCEGHNSLTDATKAARLLHVIQPLLDSLGFKLMGKNNAEWHPESEVSYYNWIESDTAYLKKTIRVTDPSLFINHGVVHLIAQLPECEGSVRHWHDMAINNMIYDADSNTNIPSRAICRQAVSDPPHNQDPSVHQALFRYQTLPLQGLVKAVTDWWQHESYAEGKICDLNVWRRPTKTDGVEMFLTCPGRTPLAFVRSTTPTRKKVEETRLTCRWASPRVTYFVSKEGGQLRKRRTSRVTYFVFERGHLSWLEISQRMTLIRKEIQILSCCPLKSYKGDGR